MTKATRSTRKSTIVLFLVSATTAVLAAGCGSLPERAGLHAPCPAVATLVCEDFGPESRCTCADRGVIDRELSRFGFAAQSGRLGW